MGRRIEGPPGGNIRKFVPDIEAKDGGRECALHGRLPQDVEFCEVAGCHDSGTFDSVWRNLEDSEPVTVTIKAPTQGDKRRMYQAARSQTVSINAKGERFVSVDMDDDALNKAAILPCVVSVTNYWGTDGEPITTPQQLLDHGEPEVVTEVCTEITSAWSAIEKDRREKKSARLSGFTPQSTKASDTTAANASTTATMPLEIVMAEDESDSESSPSSAAASTDAQSLG